MGPRSVSTPTGERARLTQRGSTAPARTRRSWLHRLLQIHSPPLAAIEGSISCRQQRHNPAIAALLKHPSRHAPRLAASGIVEIRRIATGSTEGLFDEGSLQPRVGIPKCRHGRIGIMHNIEQSAENLTARTRPIIQNDAVAFSLDAENGKRAAIVENARASAF